jgi:hypothetical protein
MSTNATNMNLNMNKNAIGLRNKYIILLIFYFIITVVILVYNVPEYIASFLTTDKNRYFSGLTIWIIMLFLIFSFIAVVMILIYNNESKGIQTIGQINNTLFINFLKAFASILFIVFILWIIGTFIKNINSTNTGGKIIDILLIVCGLAIIYKLLSLTSLLKSPIVRIIIHSILYIPCLLVSLVELLAHEYKITTKPIVILIIIGILLIILYFIYPKITNKIYTYGGKQVLNKPIALNSENSISTYQNLNETYEHTYQYALSLWFYIDSVSQSMNSNYLKFTNILSYGNNPSIQYNPSSNTLTVTITHDNDNTISVVDVTQNLERKITTASDEEIIEIKKKISDVVDKIQHLPIISEINQDGKRVIYKNDKVLLQKWNNVILNYNGGTLDIFYNGKLVKSAVEVVPYIKYDTMIAGETNGISGGIANVMYYKEPLDIHKINKLYKSMKNKNPPCLEDSNILL